MTLCHAVAGALARRTTRFTLQQAKEYVRAIKHYKMEKRLAGADVELFKQAMEVINEGE